MTEINTNAGGERISISEAARLRKVHRERIRQYIEDGRLDIAKQIGRNIWVYTEQVLNITHGHQGRPEVPLAEKKKRAEHLGFPLGTIVRWETETGRDGKIKIDELGIVYRNGSKRVRIRIKDRENEFHWVKPEHLTILDDQSGAEVVEIDPGQRLVPITE